MKTIDILNKEFFAQEFSEIQPYSEELTQYKRIAYNYARMENAVAVLSDLRSNASYVYYGGFARMLGIDKGKIEDQLHSIWEEEIFQLVHPDDLAEKHLQELCFFHFIKRQPKAQRVDYYLASKLRMKNGQGSYIPVLHRMFYIHLPSRNSLWLALCLYSPWVWEMPAPCVIIHSTDGRTVELAKQNHAGMLSAREKQVLHLIDKGLMSKDIAQMLSISIHTVSRHRQEILSKLQAKNSIDACRIAKDLKLI